MLISFLFFMCFVAYSGDGYDCSYGVTYMYSADEVNEQWTGKGKVAAFFDEDRKWIYLYQGQDFTHEWRHADCFRHYDHFGFNNAYCESHPHFKILE